ncbi:hypothetical protein G6F57_003099 [Rhizopus arrhizus]|uniref:HMG box domain-containing protein n=1 Tax=Rhizopus oryzae TaxID=64495 RepID=A0A9P7BUQ3_RHIOR|nr:hypothetical protein G6F23_005212 [Rhizopus arrhizus]KAG1417616.1 hypothetical protein G6F58_005431 [Rhizopus delemar]KAG0767395.1 hypothetical protein G6F24_002830 [Rhizopus arrhizus]KAG0796839.1 hypothetical protein G6F21_001001 [Rhizopus arrhizus]KAG0815324.1 hypothetical protein G6F20_004083 [Rhizopus arrhizus]
MNTISLDFKHKTKYDELKKRYRAIEEENEILEQKLCKARRHIKRLRLERSLLLERVDKVNNDHHSDSGSEILHNDFEKHKNIKPKKKKDPNAPKGPGNVFFLFCRMERDKIKVENPEENIGDVTRLLALKWKGLTKEEKKVYYDTFKKEMDEYEEAMKSYKEGLIDSPPHIQNDIPIIQHQQHPEDIFILNTENEHTL